MCVCVCVCVCVCGGGGLGKMEEGVGVNCENLIIAMMFSFCWLTPLEYLDF